MWGISCKPLIDEHLGRHFVKVADHEPMSWFLFELEGKLYLDVNCSHSVFGFSVLFELNDAEAAAYATEGRAYLQHLAGRVQDHTFTEFMPRNLAQEWHDRATAAVLAWRQTQANT